MKQCPKCQKIYTDETLVFCLDNGSKLSKIERIDVETLNAASFKPKVEITRAETVQVNQPTENEYSVLSGAVKNLKQGYIFKERNFEEKCGL